MSGFLSIVFMLGLGFCFIRYNERKERKLIAAREDEQEQGERKILHDAVIKYADGSVMHIYEAKTPQPNMICHTFHVGPNSEAVLATNMEEIREIEKYHAHLLDCGLHLSMEEAAMAWATIKAKAWRHDHFRGIPVEDVV